MLFQRLEIFLLFFDPFEGCLRRFLFSFKSFLEVFQLFFETLFVLAEASAQAEAFAPAAVPAADAAFAAFVLFEVSFLPPKLIYSFEKMREDVAPSLSLYSYIYIIAQ